MSSRSQVVSYTLLAISATAIGLLIFKYWPNSHSQDSSVFNQASADAAAHSVIQIGPPTTHEKLNAANDQWYTEVLHDQIKKQLGKLAEHIQQHDLTDDFVASITADPFTANGFDAKQLRTIFDDGTIQVRRVEGADSPDSPTDDLMSFLKSHLQLPDTSIARCSFKVVSILADSETNSVSANVLVEVQRTGDVRQQQNALWSTTWSTMGDPVRLSNIQVESLEQVSVQGRSIWEDATVAVLGKTNSFPLHVLRSIDHWNLRMPSIDDTHIFGHHGIAVGDVNGDGWEDLYVCDTGGLPNRLYLHQADGTVTDHSATAQVDWLEASTAALLVDLDEDGDLDLVVATVAALVFAANDGTGTFQVRNAVTGLPEAQSLCAADYDNDGDVDLYVCNYGQSGGPGSKRGYEGSAPIPYNDANNGGPNALLQNNGQFQFANVTTQVGLDQNNRRFSFAASWEDFDQDGDVDLYVANDFGRNNLYRNDGGRFADIASTAAVEDMAGGMSVSWGDFDRNGRMDLYVGNMFSAAGNRVTFQRQFVDRYQDRSQAMQRMARGNTLFAARPDGSFDDVSEALGVNMGRWAWSSCFADINNDGWQDLVIANGYFTNQKVDDL